MTASPDPNHLSQWGKKAELLWLAPWTRSELKTALPYLLRDNRPEVVEQALARYLQVGGTLRHLTASEGQLREHVGAMESKSKGLSVEQLAKIVEDVSSVEAKSGVLALNVSHKLLHVWPSPIQENTKQRLTVDIASPYVREVLMKAWSEAKGSASLLSRLLSQLKGCEGSGGWRGWIYELAVFTAARRHWVGKSVEARIWQAPADSGAENGETRSQLKVLREQELGENPALVAVRVRKVVHLNKHVSAEDTATLLEP